MYKYFKTTLDPYMREFQFRILHNYLPVNAKLFKWKLIDSDKCAYCYVEKETMHHLFCDCPKSVTLYRQIQAWCNEQNIILPNLCISEVLYNCLSNDIEYQLINHILFLYKYTVYFNKENSANEAFLFFKGKLKETEKIEYCIAKKRNVLAKHLLKWEKYLNYI